MNRTRILFLSPEDENVSFLADVLSNVEGYTLRFCSEESAAEELFASFLPAITVVNLNRNFSDALLNRLREISPAARFLGFCKNPLNLPQFHRHFFSALLSNDELRVRFMTEILALKEQSALVANINEALSRIVGHSPAVKKLYDTILKAIRGKGATVLIQGESGVGKELVARAIASVSANTVSVNCSAISESLFESELFGHTRGSFTGAVTDRKGLFEAANGGVLYLDEVGDIPLSMQAKLLRALQEGEIRPVGSTEARKVKVRVIAATNHDLQKEISDGRFREDLFYRLDVIPIHVPALRERKEDIPELVSYFVRKYAQTPDVCPHISDETMQAILRYDWPGNIRELENSLHRAIVLMDGDEISREHLFPSNFRAESAPIRPSWEGIGFDEFQEILKKAERDFIVCKVRENGGSVKSTADSLGILRPALYARAARVGLDLKSLHRRS